MANSAHLLMIRLPILLKRHDRNFALSFGKIKAYKET